MVSRQGFEPPADTFSQNKTIQGSEMCKRNSEFGGKW